MKKVLATVLSLAFAAICLGENIEVNGHTAHAFPSRNAVSKTRGNSNLSYHNGPVLVAARVIPIFWGTYWGSGSGATQASTMQSFYEQFGTNREYAVITQYYDVAGGSTNYIGLSTLEPTGGGTAGKDYWYDGTNPSNQNVTDAMVQAEVVNFLTSNNQAVNTSAIYEVFIGPAFYSSSGSSDSCGGPNLKYCAYHSSFTYNGANTKYSIEPYPSCSGCWSFSTSNGDPNNIYDMQHFACHESREAVTDEDGNAWYDRTGYEADDKCAWTPAPFKDGGYAYQYEWSNKNGGCIQY